MAAASKVRLVRCPKCGNLLPELPDYSVYQCGGCDTILRAKKKVIGNDGLLEKPVKETDGEGIEKLEYLSEKENGGLVTESEPDKASDGVINTRRKEILGSSSSSRVAETRETLLSNMSRIVMEQKMGYQSGPENIDRKLGKYRQPLKPPIDNRVEPDVGSRNTNGLESSVHLNRGRGGGEASRFKDSAGSLRSSAPGRWDFHGTGRKESYGDGRMAHESRKLPMFAHSDEGPLNTSLASTSYGNGKSVNAYSEQDRNELLQKLDELKEQLSRYGSVAEKQRFQDPVDSRSGPPVNHRRYPTYGSSIQPLAPDKRVVDAPYFNPYERRRVLQETVLHAGMQNLHLPSNIPGREDLFQQQIPRRHPPYLPRPYSGHQQPNAYFPGQYTHFNQQPFPSYNPDPLSHPPVCSCFQCRNKKWPNPSHAAPAVFDYRKVPNESMDSRPAAFRPVYNPRANAPVVRSRQMERNAAQLGVIDEDIDGFRRRDAQKQVVPHKSVQLCNPIAGGAPFITCCSCFESLTVPKIIKASKKFQHKLRCGACSKVLLLKTENKRVVVSVYAENLPLSNEVHNKSSDSSKQVLSSSNVHLNDSEMDCFYDFDSQSYNIDSVDFKELQEDTRRNVAEFGKRQQHSSPFSGSPLEEEKPEKLTGHSSKPPSKDDTPTSKIVPFDECSDDVSYSNAVDRKGKENRSRRMEQEKSMLDKINSRKNSVKDTLEPEVEVSFNDYIDGSFSQESAEVSKEVSSRTRKGTESFLVGFIKKSLREFSRSNQSLDNERPSVFVNGQPISESMLKKAEKLAGPIHPGDYWYDRQGGFWGAMGHPCSGIIPPSIEEFSYPLTRNCASGNTNIFVNGRELHQNDLELLSSRGLPTTGGKHYVIDITGKVIDEGTREELCRLGRLAPTVEKMKRGFGMKVPGFVF